MIVIKKAGDNKTTNLVPRDLLDSFEFILNDSSDYLKIKEVSPLVASIDLYSDTFIGEPQKEIYISGFKKLRDININSEFTLFCGKMIELLSELQTPGEYLVFVGD
jgi:hypothetical protein